MNHKAVSVKQVAIATLVTSVALVAYMVAAPIVSAAANSSADEVPRGIEHTFMTECLINGGNQAFCDCLVDGLESQLSANEFIDLMNADKGSSQQYRSSVNYVSDSCKRDIQGLGVVM